MTDKIILDEREKERKRPCLVGSIYQCLSMVYGVDGTRVISAYSLSL